MKNKYVIAPEKCKSYLTPGRKYEILWSDKNAFEIANDMVNTIYCLYKCCAHLYGGDWIIVKE